MCLTVMNGLCFAPFALAAQIEANRTLRASSCAILVALNCMPLLADKCYWCRRIARLGQRSFVVLKSRAGMVDRGGVCVTANT